MRGLMMDRQLSIASILTYAATRHGEVEIVSRTVEGPIHRYTYADAARRTAKLAHALQALGAGPGNRVATLAWNTFRHFELYYAISGMGAVAHTINPRLHASQIAFIINHADDRFVFLDTTFVPLLESIAAQTPRVKAFVLMCEESALPPTSLPNALSYEALMAPHSSEFAWPDLDENTASSLCYTSGTTGDPKGVLYTHRSTVLHAFSSCMSETGRPFENNRALMPIVPMFHVNAWGLPYCAPMSGAKLVLPGALHDAEPLYDLLENECVTTAGAVPVIWQRLLTYLETTGKPLRSLTALRVGGSAAPAALIEAYERRGIEVVHGWGMTETSPVCTNGSIKGEHRAGAERLNYQLKAGRCMFGVDMKIVGEDGQTLPEDGASQGELLVRGPWVASAYYNDPAATAAFFTADGWFRTGDVATLDADGYLTIFDRSKDLIKSGGEWISSIDLENVAVGHPGVEEAAAIAIPDAEWAERPMLVVVRKAGSALDAAELNAYLAERVAKWWLPDEIRFIADMPHTATGKISKKTLRERYAQPATAAGI
ncbi:MAG: long-chain fatty acid--CoA ligase [Candidatus Eremiobacteraeota bacterium]|nr:long-chain fatty acid--CoA ligase [Candidatus Eremiobacteraeota bacterium]